MPQYTVTDPTSNKTITLTGDSPPTEQELNDIFAHVNAQSNSPGFFAGVKQGFQGQDVPAQSTSQGIGQWVGREGPALAGSLGAAALTDGASIPISAAAQALGAGGGEAARLISQEIKGNGPQTSREAASDIAIPAASYAGSDLALKGVVSPLLSKAKEEAQTMLGRMVGLRSPFIKRVMENPSILSTKNITTPLTEEEIQHAAAILKGGVDSIGSKVGEIENRMLKPFLDNPQSAPNVDVKGLLSKLGDLMSSRKVNVPGNAKIFAQEGLPASEVDMLRNIYSHLKSLGESSPATLKNYQEGLAIPDKLKLISDMIQKQGGAKFHDLLNFRRAVIDNALEFNSRNVNPISSSGEAALKELRGHINDELYKQAPDLKGANLSYTKARNAYDDLVKAMGKGPADAESKIRLQIFRHNAPETLIKKSAQINEASGRAMKQLVDRVSAREFSPMARRGMVGSFAIPSSVLAAFTGHPLEALSLLATEAATAPRTAAFLIRNGARLGNLASHVPVPIPPVSALGLGISSVANDVNGK